LFNLQFETNLIKRATAGHLQQTTIVMQMCRSIRQLLTT